VGFGYGFDVVKIKVKMLPNINPIDAYFFTSVQRTPYLSYNLYVISGLSRLICEPVQ
jgi:hypothetical protein